MINIIPENKLGDFSIEYFEIDDLHATLESMRGTPTYPGKYVRLKHGKELVMSDTYHEKITNNKFINSAFGKVLMAGMGIGYCVIELFKKIGYRKQDIISVTVIEKYQEVLDLTVPHLRKYLGENKNKLFLIHADVFDYLKRKPDTKYDCIYFDIWNEICTDNYPEIKQLHRLAGKWRKKDNPDNFVDSWCRQIVRRNYLKDKKNGGI